MMKSPLEVALDHYQTALNILENATSQPSVEQIIEILTARDEVQQILNNSSPHESKDLIRIIDLDRHLQQQIKVITKTINLADWRVSFNPSAEAWWWFLEPPPHPFDQLDWLWSGISVACLTITVSMVMDISSRFLSGGTDVLGTLTISVQSVLTLLTAQGALTETGKQGIEHFLARLNLPKYWWREVQCGLAAALLLGVYGLYATLPRIAIHYRESGFHNYKKGLLSSAESDYQRALAINSDNVETNFYLGLVYEDLQDIEKARNQYQIAVLGGYKIAYNNLARLYILQKDYPAAAFLLQRLRSQGIDPKDIPLNYGLYKNLGWLQLEQNQLAAAKGNLNIAMELNPNEASAYCLLAQVLEKQDAAKNALPNWENCLAYASGITPEEANWIGLAQEKINRAANKPSQPKKSQLTKPTPKNKS